MDAIEAEKLAGPNPHHQICFPHRAIWSGPVDVDGIKIHICRVCGLPGRGLYLFDALAVVLEFSPQQIEELKRLGKFDAVAAAIEALRFRHGIYG